VAREERRGGAQTAALAVTVDRVVATRAAPEGARPARCCGDQGDGGVVPRGGGCRSRVGVAGGAVRRHGRRSSPQRTSTYVPPPTHPPHPQATVGVGDMLKQAASAGAVSAQPQQPVLATHAQPAIATGTAQTQPVGIAPPDLSGVTRRYEEMSVAERNAAEMSAAAQARLREAVALQQQADAALMQRRQLEQEAAAELARAQQATMVDISNKVGELVVGGGTGCAVRGGAACARVHSCVLPAHLPSLRATPHPTGGGGRGGARRGGPGRQEGVHAQGGGGEEAAGAGHRGVGGGGRREPAVVCSAARSRRHSCANRSLPPPSPNVRAGGGAAGDGGGGAAPGGGGGGAALVAGGGGRDAAPRRRRQAGRAGVHAEEVRARRRGGVAWR
jgi:hypothetical protein